ncbi:MAG: IS200/IS605 family transposase [Phycisphaerae bacterium]
MGQTLTCLHYHLVFSTKNRLPQITADSPERLYDYMGGIIKGERGILFNAGGTEDHVHLLVSLPAQPSVADFLRLVKTNSSKWIHETFEQHRAFAWQSGYGAFSVSRSNDDDHPPVHLVSAGASPSNDFSGGVSRVSSPP